MKKIFVFLIILLLSGCTKTKLENVEIDRNHYANTFDWVALGIADNGLYYIDDEILYYKEDNENAVALGSVNYVDGEKVQTESGSFITKTRIDLFNSRDLICYGDRIYMEYNTIEHSGSSYYQLASVNLKGEDFKTHIIFDYIPQRIVMNNGKVYVYYENLEENKYYIDIYNQNFELINTEYFDSELNAIDFCVENGEILVPDDKVIYENDNIRISFKYEFDSGDNYKSFGSIKIGSNEFTFKDKTVLFVNDKYFYIASDTYPQTYERYHLNGELDKSIVINEHLKSEGNISYLNNSDFSYILKLRNEDIAYGFSGGGEYPRIFEVNFEKGTCNYVDE